jgi:POT family proton-dependent oligopeptide transporter
MDATQHSATTNTKTHSDKHPSSLRVFFATEMWERYGFYVVQALLALYLAYHFKWPDKDVYALVSLFTAMNYLSPIIGGWIADNLLGQKNTILTGAFCLFLSYIALSVVDSTFGLIAALSAISVGTGLLKPNIASLLGNEYEPDSPKRESGFVLFYLGITTGIILGTTLPSYIQAYFGWSSAFLSASFGMILALSIFSFGIKHYKIQDYHPFKHDPGKILTALLLIALVWCVSFYILYNPEFADISFGLFVLFAIATLVSAIRQESGAQRNQTIVIGLLSIISSIFWAFYFQMFTSLTLFIARVVEPKLFGIFFPAPYYVAIQSFGMLVIGYFIAKSNTKGSAKQSGIRSGNKFIWSLSSMLLAFAIIVISCFGSTGYQLLSPLLLIPSYLLFSVAELLLSPVGLSAMTILASRAKVSTMMGIFYVSLGIGAFFSGKLAFLTAVEHPEGTPLLELKMHYAHTFGNLLIILFITTAICVVLNFIIKKLLNRI